MAIDAENKSMPEKQKSEIEVYNISDFEYILQNTQNNLIQDELLDVAKIIAEIHKDKLHLIGLDYDIVRENPCSADLESAKEKLNKLKNENQILQTCRLQSINGIYSHTVPVSGQENNLLRTWQNQQQLEDILSPFLPGTLDECAELFTDVIAGHPQNITVGEYNQLIDNSKALLRWYYGLMPHPAGDNADSAENKLPETKILPRPIVPSKISVDGETFEIGKLNDIIWRLKYLDIDNKRVNEAYGAFNELKSATCDLQDAKSKQRIADSSKEIWAHTVKFLRDIYEKRQEFARLANYWANAEDEALQDRIGDNPGGEIHAKALKGTFNDLPYADLLHMVHFLELAKYADSLGDATAVYNSATAKLPNSAKQIAFGDDYVVLKNATYETQIPINRETANACKNLLQYYASSSAKKAIGAPGIEKLYS